MQIFLCLWKTYSSLRSIELTLFIVDTWSAEFFLKKCIINSSQVGRHICLHSNGLVVGLQFYEIIKSSKRSSNFGRSVQGFLLKHLY